MTITLNGSTGITSPEVALDNGTADGGQVVLKSSGYSNWNIDNYSGSLRNYYGSTVYTTLDSSGNFGIGTSSPSSYAKLVVVSPDNNGYTNVVTALSNNLAQTTSLTFAGLRAGSGSGIGFYVNGSTSSSANIDTSGNFMVGTTSQIQSGKISVLINPTTNNGFTVSPSANADYDAMSMQNNAGSKIGSIRCTTTATSYNTSSDYRLKENIAPMTGALAKLALLKPCTYTWKENGETSQGFIAHELQAVVPDCVTGEKDAVDADGNPVYQGIDTSFLVATLTAAIQEQLAIITDLKARIEVLENK